TARQSAEAARNEATTTGSVVAQQVTGLGEATDRMKKQLVEIAQTLDGRITAMGKITETALARAGSLGGDFEAQIAQLGRAIDQASGKADRVGQSFKQQSAELDRSANAAMEKMEQLRETQQNATRDTFLRTARVMTEELNSLALDIHNLLDAEIPEEV